MLELVNKDNSPNTKLVAIVGQTASGKTALAVSLAQKFNGEIIAADSRTVYRGLDIGTAKPTAVEQDSVPHHLLDVVRPDEEFNAATFKNLANQAIERIHSLGKVAFLTGGTGLYVDAVLYDYNFPEFSTLSPREYWDGLSTDELVKSLQDINPEAASRIDIKNRHRLIRAQETAGKVGSKKSLRPNTLIIGLKVDKEVLLQRIQERVDKMVANGLESEIAQIAATYGWDNKTLTGIGYRAFRKYLDKKATLDEAKAAFVKGDMYLAKRQMTWFKRNPDIHWVDSPEQAEAAVKHFIGLQ